jgi:hypothetical protein
MFHGYEKSLFSFCGARDQTQPGALGKYFTTKPHPQSLKNLYKI